MKIENGVSVFEIYLNFSDRENEASKWKQQANKKAC